MKKSLLKRIINQKLYNSNSQDNINQLSQEFNHSKEKITLDIQNRIKEVNETVRKDLNNIMEKANKKRRNLENYILFK